jgi:hypothetical protein
MSSGSCSFLNNEFSRTSLCFYTADSADIIGIVKISSSEFRHCLCDSKFIREENQSG